MPLTPGKESSDWRRKMNKITFRAGYVVTGEINASNLMPDDFLQHEMVAKVQQQIAKLAVSTIVKKGKIEILEADMVEPSEPRFVADLPELVGLVK